MTERPYYSYVLYLRADPKRNLVAESETIAMPLLKRHRLVDAAAAKTWNRTGQAPISFEQRSGPQQDYDEMETNDGVSFSELFPVPLVERLPGRARAPIGEVVIRIGVPGRLDIPAYVEGVQVAVALANKLKAPVIFDEETRERRTREEWESRAHEGRISRFSGRSFRSRTRPCWVSAARLRTTPSNVGGTRAVCASSVCQTSCSKTTCRASRRMG